MASIVKDGDANFSFHKDYELQKRMNLQMILIIK